MSTKAIVAMIRAIEAEYRTELRSTAHKVSNPDYARATHKASMAAVIAAKIERGDHLDPATWPVRASPR